MTTLTKRRSMLPSIVSDLFDGERFLPSSIFDIDGGLTGMKSLVPSVNIRETDKDYQLELAAPGLERKDFKVEMENGTLNVSCEKEEEREEKDENYRRREFSYNSFSRSFNLPENVIKEKIDANYKDGILKVNIPKKEVSQKSAKKEIKVS